MSTLQSLSANVVLDIDPRKNSLLDQSGNNNNAVNSGCLWVNTNRGRGIKIAPYTYLTVADSPNLQITEGVLLVFGDFQKQLSGTRFMYKRNGGGTNFDFYVNTSNTVGVYTGATASTATVNIIGTKMIAVKIGVGVKPVFYVNGVNVGVGSTNISLSMDDAPLIIGNTSTTLNSLENVITRAVILNTSSVTDQQMSQIYDEYIASKGVLHNPRRNINFIKPKEKLQSCKLSYDFPHKTVGGDIVDQSGNGNNGVVTNPLIAGGSDIQASYFNGATSAVVRSNAGIGSFTECSIIALVRFDDIAPLQYFLQIGGINDGAQVGISGSRIRLDDDINNVNGGANGITLLNSNQWYWIQVDFAANGTMKAYIDNNLEINYAGEQFGDIASNNVTIGNRYGTLFFRGDMGLCRIYDTALTDNERNERYSQYARHIKFKHDMEDVYPTVNDVTDGPLANSEFSVYSGTHKVSVDSNGKKWVECVSAGVTYMNSLSAYGTWVFEFNKSSSPTALDVIILSTIIGDKLTTGQYGYIQRFVNNGQPAFQKTTNGSSANLSVASASYFDTDTDYKYAITRSVDGEFTLYIKGGAFTSWTLVDSSVAGSNPATDTTTTSSKYFNVDADAGDKYRLLGIHQGVLTLGKLNELY